MTAVTMLLAALPIVGDVSNTTLLCTAVALVLAYFFVFGKLRPRSIRYPRSTFPEVKGRKVPGSECAGATPSYTSPIPMKRTEGVTTLHDNFLQGWRAAKHKPCLGERPIDANGDAGPYEWATYDQVRTRIIHFGSGMANMDLAPRRQEPGQEAMRFMGFYSKNCAEWVVAAQACNLHGVVIVPLYDTLGASAVEYVVKQTQLTSVMCTGAEVPTVLEVAARCPCLRNIVVFKTPNPSADAKWKATYSALPKGHVTIHAFGDVEANGENAPVDPPTVSPHDVATFCYTSGTTGDPKGAMLTHDNILSCQFGAQSVGVLTTPDDVHISYLPLAHMFERIVQEAMFHGGARLGFFQGDTAKLLDDIGTLRPTIFPSVPRLYNKIYDKVMAGAMAGGLKTVLFKKALAAKMEGLQQGYLEHPLWDKLVFSKVGKRVGLDRCRLMLTGSAPIAAHVLDFLRIAFMCPVQEGYGQTESAAAATITLPDDYSSGHVGGPLPCNEVRLVDVPDMEYLSTDTEHGGKPCLGRGEICFRGPNVFKGYYKNPAKTAEAIDSEGWLHSGDIGLWTEKLELRIIDRKKNIFKLSQGEYVAAEKIENVNAGASTFVAQNFVYGDSYHHCLVAIVVPDPDYAAVWAKKNDTSGDIAALCGNKAFRAAVLADLNRVGRAKGLHGFEIVKAVHLEPELWTAENGILTPTFKLKRNVAKKKYQAQIDDMYESIGASVGGVRGLRQGAE